MSLDEGLDKVLIVRFYPEGYLSPETIVGLPRELDELFPPVFADLKITVYKGKGEVHDGVIIGDARRVGEVPFALSYRCGVKDQRLYHFGLIECRKPEEPIVRANSRMINGIFEQAKETYARMCNETILTLDVGMPDDLR